MSVWRCQNCRHVMGIKRLVCPKCLSEIIMEEGEGNVISEYSLHLYSSPEGFPDSYSVICYRTSLGTHGFCISNKGIDKGKKITVHMMDGKSFCDLKSP